MGIVVLARPPQDNAHQGLLPACAR